MKCHVMDIDEIRRVNMRAIEKEAGTPTAAANLVGMTLAQFSNLRDGAKDSKTGRPRGMRKDTARKIESAAGKPEGWLDQDHGVAATPFLPGFQALSIPLLANSGSMGPGNDDLHDEVVIGRLTVSPDWARRVVKPTKLDHLRFIHGYGDSMEPTFADGDVLLVDLGVRDPKIDGVYVLEANDRIYIKRVRERMDGSMEISSDNPTVKTVDILDGSTQVTVHGRVVWRWNGRKM